MQTASFQGVLKVIFYFIVFYYLFKFAMRIILPVLLKKAVQKAEENLRQRDQGMANETIYPKSKASKPADSKIGEYIDFEEIE